MDFIMNNWDTIAYIAGAVASVGILPPAVVRWIPATIDIIGKGVRLVAEYNAWKKLPRP